MGAGFIMKAVLLLACGKKQAADHATDQDNSAQPHIDQRHGQGAKHQSRQHGA